MRALSSAVLAVLLASASFGALLHHAKSGRLIGGDVVSIQLYDSSRLDHSDSLVGKRSKFIPAQPPATPEVMAIDDAEGLDSQKNSRSETVKHSVQAISAYLPASLLSERPQLLTDIDTEWYLLGTDMPELSAMLLINEFGDVDDFIVETPSLTPMLLEDLRVRFQSARFIPGSQDGQPVKTMLRIMIRLD